MHSVLTEKIEDEEANGKQRRQQRGTRRIQKKTAK